VNKNPTENFQDLLKLVKKLRSAQGCPWDRKQNFISLKPALIEETYEVISAIDKKNPAKLREELGDLLFLVIFYSQIAQEKNKFDFDEILKGTLDKMVRRHPHVFGLRKARSANEAYQRWQQAKSKEYVTSTAMISDLPHHLPALIKASKLQKKASKFGFDWVNGQEVLTKIDEELKELKEAVKLNKKDKIEGELGDLFFSLVNLARFLNIDSEEALHKTIQKFIKRFSYMEKELRRTGKQLRDCKLEEMERIWQRSKGKKDIY
jgi:tetrapyrrole methylase family protein/MazG family protein